MTFIYEVITWGREGNRVDGRLTSLVGRGTRFCEGPEFGLQLLMDAWFHGFGASDIDAATAQEFEECFELFLGKRIWIDAEGTLLDEDTRLPVEPRVNALERFADQFDGGGWDGHEYRTIKPRGDEFRRRTERVIASFAMEPEGDDEHASFAIEVTDLKYLAHMKEHHAFQTAFTGCLPKA